MIKSVLIVGGGSAGWITANMLNADMKRANLPVQITLIESPDIPTIGVGEATVPSIRRTMTGIGLSEQDLMQSAEATFKTLIRFIDWNKGEAYDHPFDRRPRPGSEQLARQWSARNGKRFDQTVSVLSQIADENLAPKTPQTPQYQANFPYAYHLDAIKLANRLSDFGRERGIQHVQAKIEAVSVQPDGQIASVTTDQGETYSADLFVDCTGFRSVLLGDALNVGVKTYSDYLLCDRAVTMRVPYDVYKPEQIVTYTRSIARDAGWQWDINLQTRRGLGYVYSSAFLSDDEAEAQLRAFEGPHTKDIPANRIKFASTKRHVSWKKNCVAIGLSDGFLEPLESSGLYMIEYGAQMLGLMLQDFAHAPDATIRNFNRNMDDLYEEVLSFINLHYVISNRRDTLFWRAATADSAIWSGLKDKLEIWQNRPPHDMDMHGPQRLFALDSFEFILHGMNYVAPDHGLTPTMPDHTEILKKCRTHLPKHEVFLDLLARASKAMA